MTIMFARLRRWGHAFVFVFAVVVLALTAVQANAFLPHLHEDFIIFSLIVTAGTMLILILLTSYSQPRTELTCFIVCDIAWVAEAAWVTDIIGTIQCDAISSSQRIATAHGTMSYQAYCYEMKVLEAFSWMNFGLFMLFTLLLISLTTRAHSLGRPFIWAEPIAELPWFGQLPGYENGEEGSEAGGYMYGDPRYRMYGGGGGGGGYPGQFYPGMQQQPMMGQQFPGGPYVVQQQPGHSIVIQPGQNGQQATISQVPGMGV